MSYAPLAHTVTHSVTMFSLVKKVVWLLLFLAFIYQMSLNVAKFSKGYTGMSISEESGDRHAPISFIICTHLKASDSLAFAGFVDWIKHDLFVDNKKEP